MMNDEVGAGTPGGLPEARVGKYPGAAGSLGLAVSGRRQRGPRLQRRGAAGAQ